VYFSYLHFLLTRVKIGLAFKNPHIGMERLTLRRKVDSQDRIPWHTLAPGVYNGKRSEGPFDFA
jgi:hypothetical protein